MQGNPESIVRTTKRSKRETDEAVRQVRKREDRKRDEFLAYQRQAKRGD